MIAAGDTAAAADRLTDTADRSADIAVRTTRGCHPCTHRGSPDPRPRPRCVATPAAAVTRVKIRPTFRQCKQQRAGFGNVALFHLWTPQNQSTRGYGRNLPNLYIIRKVAVGNQSNHIQQPKTITRYTALVRFVAYDLVSGRMERPKMCPDPDQ